MSQTRSLECDRILRDLTDDELLTLQDLLNSGFAVNDVFSVVLHITAIQNCILRSSDIYESRFHTRQDILNFADINVAVNLRHVIGWTADIVLNQTAAFHHRYLGEVVTNLNSHEVTTDRSAVTFATFAAFNNGCI